MKLCLNQKINHMDGARQSFSIQQEIGSAFIGVGRIDVFQIGELKMVYDPNSDFESNWKNALRRAALEGAIGVYFARKSNPAQNTVSFMLKSVDKSGHVIGDNRDYDELKAVMRPLESLADKMRSDSFEVVLDVKSEKITFID